MYFFWDDLQVFAIIIYMCFACVVTPNKSKDIIQVGFICTRIDKIIYILSLKIFICLWCIMLLRWCYNSLKHCCFRVQSEAFIVKNYRIVTYCAHIWHQHRKCIKMRTKKRMFGPVVLEIACDIFTNHIFFLLEHVVSVERIKSITL